MSQLPFAHGGPPLHGGLRSTPEDFQVVEDLGYTADGEGEHVLLLVEKRETNTQWVARELARFAGVTPREVGYAGLKDRHAVTRQAFSVQMAGRVEPDWSAFPHAEVQVLESARHRRKLKRGALRGNRFRLVIRGVTGDKAAAEAVIECLRAGGVPNYFGEQRFGHGGANVDRALAMFVGKRVDKATRSLLISAARSALFNEVLARRVAAHCWDQPVDGEIWSLDGSRSWFGPQAMDADLTERLATGDIHPSGPMWGCGQLPTQLRAAELEQDVASSMPDLAAGLESVGLSQDRRALRLLPRGLTSNWLADDVLELEFALPAGAYATVVMRELVAEIGSVE